jgi:hypothetical protein
MSPKDDTPIVMNGTLIDSVPIPSIYKPKSPLMNNTIIASSKDSDDDDDSDDDTTVITNKIAIVDDDSDSDVDIHTFTQPSTALYEESDNDSDDDVDVSIVPTPINNVQQIPVTVQPVPIIQPSPVENVAPKKVNTPIINSTYTIPKTISTSSQVRLYRPTDIPEYEFYNEETALSQLDSKDYYESSSHWKMKCDRLYARTPKLPPPIFKEKESPKMARFKYTEYYKRCTAKHSAIQAGILAYLVIGGIELLLTWFGVKASGLFSTIFKNKDEYEDAMLEMGESTLGWFNSGSTNPMYKMGISILISVVILAITNYAIAYFSISPALKVFIDKHKDGTVKWIQDLTETFLGTKSLDIENPNDTGSNLLNMLTTFMGINTSSNEPKQSSQKSKTQEFYDE